MSKEEWYILPEVETRLERFVRVARTILHHLPEIGYSSSHRAKLHPDYITQEERLRQIRNRTPEEEMEVLGNTNRWDDMGNYHDLHEEKVEVFEAEQLKWLYPDER